MLQSLMMIKNREFTAPHTSSLITNFLFFTNWDNKYYCNVYIAINGHSKFIREWNNSHHINPSSHWIVTRNFISYLTKLINAIACTIEFYIITQVILAFWLVLAYDLLEDRCTIDVIIAKVFTLCFKTAEIFENSDNILHDWAKDKFKKSTVETLNRYEKHSLAERRKMKPFLSLAQKKFSNQTQNWSW